MRAACFDLSGTLVHHRRYHTIPLMPELLRSLHQDGWELKIITTWGRDTAAELLAPVYRATGLPASAMKVYSCLDKAECVSRLLAEGAESILFVDDKPEHIEAVQRLHDDRVCVYGFLGSGKYAAEIGLSCQQMGVKYALTAADLADGLGSRRAEEMEQ